MGRATRSHSPRRRSTETASTGVVVSCTVGPVIRSMTSPTTSDTVRLTMGAGAILAASRPPFTSETCLRTAFISLMAAPLLSMRRWSSCLSSSDTRPGGELNNAEEPPVTQHSARSSGPNPSASSSMALLAATLASDGTGWSASMISIRLSGPPSPRRTTTRPPATRSPRTSSIRLAIRYDALPAPSTITLPGGSYRLPPMSRPCPSSETCRSTAGAGSRASSPAMAISSATERRCASPSEVNTAWFRKRLTVGR